MNNALVQSAALVLCSYNIHAAVGRDGRFDPDRTLSVIRELDADIIALQEVQGLDLLDFLASRAGFDAIAGPTLLRQGQDYGNALLTRLPVRQVEHLDLSVPDWEPRGALNAMLDVDGQPFRVLATHFGLRPAERRRQARQVLRRLNQWDRGEMTALLGDFNEWLPWGRPLRGLNAWFERAPAPATYPASFPLLRLDRIWLRPRGRLLAIHAHQSRLARLASDHLPIVATVNFNRDEGLEMEE
ncbi:MAG: endonuclease/exonuclease/phosphatase family protein [Candidatus Competibacteraceae bacterium]|nr:MAG: endonuclease/exonuclease/phosphatase family protein [Candidatus Competibacteraceae bacterium]